MCTVLLPSLCYVTSGMFPLLYVVHFHAYGCQHHFQIGVKKFGQERKLCGNNLIYYFLEVTN